MEEADRNSWRGHFSAWLLAFAQIAFLDTPLQGAMVLAAIALLSPWGAVGAALGAAMAVLLGRKMFDHTDREWALGLGAYDCVLVGLAWGGVLSRGGAPSLLFPLAVLACLALRRPLCRSAGVLAVPVLAVPGLITAWGSLWVFTVLGADFWSYAWSPTPAVADQIAAVVAVFAAMLLKHAKAAVATACAAVATALLYHAAGGDPFSLRGAGLWAFTVAPAVFAFPATLLPGCRTGWIAAALAAAMAAATWIAWSQLALLNAVPPMMAPLFIGCWGALLLLLGRDRALFIDPELQHAAQLIAKARDAGGTVALTGAGISTASGIPDYTAGAWLEPGVPLASYGFAAFLTDPGSRALYWDACARFRYAAAGAEPNAAHRALAELEVAGLVTATVTQNVDGLHQKAGSQQVVDLHGRIGEVRCLLCGTAAAWPGDGEWWRNEMYCPQCGGFLKPAVVAFGEGIAPQSWRQAQSAAGGCKVLLVIGTQLAVTSASSLTALARANGAACIFITTGSLAYPVFLGDKVLAYPVERALPVLARYLDAASVGSAS